MSRLVSSSDFTSMCSAINLQLINEFHDAWGIDCFVVNCPDVPSLATFKWQITLANRVDDPTALGYHTELPGGVVWGIVGAEPVLKSGGAVLLGGDMTIPTISGVLSHEVLEAAGDPFVNLYADSALGFSVAREICDACEANQYEQKDTDGNEVAVSDFVLPSWFDPFGKGQTSYCNATPGPFQLAKGGYMIRRHIGTGESSVFGTSSLPWKKEGLETSLRHERRNFGNPEAFRRSLKARMVSV
jgi:hypothetical protein